jgi:hypothetical protein
MEDSEKNSPLEDGDVEFSLGHFFRAASDDCDLLLPAPAPSIRDEIIRIDFETQTHQTIALSLSVDAGPGCGGIAWQAGEVCPLSLCVPDVAYCQSFCAFVNHRFIFCVAAGLRYNVRRS